MLSRQIRKVRKYVCYFENPPLLIVSENARKSRHFTYGISLFNWKTYRKFPEIQGKILSAELFALELVLIEEFWGFWRQQQLSNWGKFPVPTRQTEANK